MEWIFYVPAGGSGLQFVRSFLISMDVRTNRAHVTLAVAYFGSIRSWYSEFIMDHCEWICAGNPVFAQINLPWNNIVQYQRLEITMDIAIYVL